MKKILFVSLAIYCMVMIIGCAKKAPSSMSEEEILKRYGDTSLWPDTLSAMIDDRNQKIGVKDRTNYAQAFESDLTQAKSCIHLLEQIESGDVKKAKEMLVIQANLNAAFLPVYQERAHIDETKLNDAREFARQLLDYLVKHNAELQPDRIDLKWSLVGLAQILAEDEEQSKKLIRLMKELYPDNNSEK